MNKRKRTGMILTGLGLLIVYGSHIGILVVGIAQEQLPGHSYINIGAGLLIGFGSRMLMRK